MGAGERQGRRGPVWAGRAQVHVCSEAAGEGNKNRENRFPGLDSRGLLRQGPWTKRGRDTPRARAPTLTPSARGTGPWKGRGPVEEDSLKCQDGMVSGWGNGLFSPFHRWGQLLSKLWRRLYREQSPHLFEPRLLWL